jgi:tRNA(Ser,Leu) C12 N-acetylase TAN1
VSAAYVTAESVEKTAEALRKLLTAQGWQPYGTAGDSLIFKQNAVRLNARATVAPAQGGKTLIDFSTEQLSVDLPAPTDTLGLQYADSTAQLLFDTSADKADIVAFYRKALSPAGWEATTEKPFKSGFKETLIFRNPAEGMLTLETYTVDEKLRVVVTQQSKAELAEIEKQIKAEAERKKLARDKPKPKFTVTLPAQAKNVEKTKTRLEFTVGAGKAKAAVSELRKQFTKAGWKEKDDATVEDMAGTIAFTRDNQDLSILYVDTGLMPAEITISSTGIELD